MRSVKPTSRPRSTGVAWVTSSAEAATYEGSIRASRKSEADIQPIDSTQASITVDTDMITSPETRHVCRPMRSMSSPMTSTSAYMPTMWRLITVKTSACSWSWPTTM